MNPGQSRDGRAVAATDILHLDMDSFFAAVETLDDASLAGRPVVVGGLGPRAVVASASYAARRFGVRSAMPMGQARRLCPGLVIVRPNHDKYAKVSGQLMEICRGITPLVEPISVDEAFLDVSGAHELFGTSLEIARRLRARVDEELRLSCAVGVGRSKLVAKLASKAAKPKARPDGIERGEGVVVVSAEDELEFLHRHPVRALPGVGPRTADRLVRVGVSTVGDLALLGGERLVAMFGSAHGTALSRLAWGDDDRPVVPDRELRSIGHEETFDTDDYDLSSLESKVREMAVSVAARCRERHLTARTVSIKVRFADFETVVRSKTERWPIAEAAEIASIGAALLATVDISRGVRLIGVSVSGLEEGGAAGRQLELFGEREGTGEPAGGGDRLEKVPAAEVAAEEIRKRFGAEAIRSVAAFGRRMQPGRGDADSPAKDAASLSRARGGRENKRATAPPDED